MEETLYTGFHLTNLLLDTHVWVLLAFIAAFAIGVKFGRKSVLSALDARTANIRDKIEEAENLRTEAQELLAKYQHKYRDAMKEADDIIKNAQIHANKARDKALDDLKDKIARMEEQAKKRLAETQEKALTDVRSFVADRAIAMAGETLEKKLKGKDRDALSKQSIEKITQSMH